MEFIIEKSSVHISTYNSQRVDTNPGYINPDAYIITTEKQPIDIDHHMLIEKAKIVVHEMTGLSYEMFNVKCRDRELVEARQLFFYFVWKYTTITLKDLGRLLKRDHATVIHSVKTWHNLMETSQKHRVLTQNGTARLREHITHVRKFGDDNLSDKNRTHTIANWEKIKHLYS